jgi:hypothetical protein
MLIKVSLEASCSYCQKYRKKNLGQGSDWTKKYRGWLGYAVKIINKNPR